MVSAAHARPPGRSRAKRWLLFSGILLAVVILWWRSGDVRDVFGRQYEYEEDLTLDSRAPAPSPSMRLSPRSPHSAGSKSARVAVDRPRPDPRVVRVWRHPGHLGAAPVAPPPGRDFVQINLAFDDVRTLSQAAPLRGHAMSSTGEGGQHLFRQIVGASALKPGTLKNVGWDAAKWSRFRLHLPAASVEHNARDLERNEPTGIRRGNILDGSSTSRIAWTAVPSRWKCGWRPFDSLSHAVPVRGRLAAAVLPWWR